ncbi:LysR family transcriptional regulator [Aestuariivita boseongensis]|uniref:LysR family transcriptional regulator n=1 Tax=Aestuariivita boseongensis TaxID=1470562 RepID=UPI00068057B5|nr:LysR family transcriptional regulator [Aestuariivita boseongensis]
MNWSGINFDWNQARAFLVTAEEGSLSAAARALGLTQPTLGRQVAALEESLGVLLFNRTGRNLTLTEAGLDLVEHVRAMANAAHGFSLTASGRNRAIEGHVTITAGDWTAVYILPRALRRLREIAPGITVEIISSNDVQDLRRREADIALRHVRPDQPELIAQKLRDDEVRLYATPRYLEIFGVPKSVRDLKGHIIAGFEPVERHLAAAQAMGLAMTRDNLRFSSASTLAMLEIVRLGEAIGMMGKDMAGMVPDLQLVTEDFTPMNVETWLVSHRELQTNRRIRLVFDLLAEELSVRGPLWQRLQDAVR